MDAKEIIKIAIDSHSAGYDTGYKAGLAAGRSEGIETMRRIADTSLEKALKKVCNHE